MLHRNWPRVGGAASVYAFGRGSCQGVCESLFNFLYGGILGLLAAGGVIELMLDVIHERLYVRLIHLF